MILNNPDEKNRHVAFICDENYVLPTCVAIKSFVENVVTDREHMYSVHIFSFGISEESKRLLNDMASNNARVLFHFLDKNRYDDRLKKINQKTHVSPTALLKFELPNLLPNINEVLYLDGDIIIKQAIMSIFEYDISEKAVAASFEFWTYLSKIYNFDGDDGVPDFNFNSGVMLLNLEYFREHKLDKQLWKVKFDECNQEDKKENMMDQTTFNIVCGKCCVHLPVCYNCNNQFVDDANVEFINKAYGTTYKSSSDIQDDAIIIHYVGKKDKPWLYTGIKCQEFWDKYCSMSGIDLYALNRKTFKKNVSYYKERLLRSIEVRGFKKTIYYLLYRRKHRM